MNVYDGNGQIIPWQHLIIPTCDSNDNLDRQDFLKTVIIFQRLSVSGIFHGIYYSFRIFYSKIFDPVPKCRYGSTCIQIRYLNWMDELYHCILSYSALSTIWHHFTFVLNQLKPPNEFYTVLITIIILKKCWPITLKNLQTGNIVERHLWTKNQHLIFNLNQNHKVIKMD